MDWLHWVLLVATVVCAIGWMGMCSTSKRLERELRGLSD